MVWSFGLRTRVRASWAVRVMGVLMMLFIGADASALPRESALSGILDRFTPTHALLPAEQAFQFSARLLSPSIIEARWHIAPGYYLYRQKFSLRLEGAGRVALAGFEWPHGLPHDDAEFGTVEIFRDELVVTIPLTGSIEASQKVQLISGFQGCADRGVCYPPITQSVALDAKRIDSDGVELLPDAKSEVPQGECSARVAEGFVETDGFSEQCTVVQALKEKTLWPILLTFLGMGVLLSLTPCVFPMIPILSGIIIGQGDRLTPARGFSLSLSYVLASALAYMVFGVVAGLFGQNLQVFFQNPWVIGSFSGLFILLGLSMFGVVRFEMPQGIQERLVLVSRGLHGGTLTGAALMGALSSLIVGPCVAAPLAGVLIYIGESGDAVLGGAALFVLGLGMGLPLLLIGVSAGNVLPKAGPWMEQVKQVFGVGMLATALWLLSRIFPSEITMLLTGGFLVILSVYLGVFDVLPSEGGGVRRLFKGVGLVFLIYGSLILVGFSEGRTDLLFPLRSHGASERDVVAPVSFNRVTSVHDLERVLEGARVQGRPVMIDFYADWCIACKEMDRDTFGDEAVESLLRQFDLIRVDVTANSDEDKALLARFHLIGPPAVVFFGRDGREKLQQRVIGFMGADNFKLTLQKVIR